MKLKIIELPSSYYTKNLGTSLHLAISRISFEMCLVRSLCKLIEILTALCFPKIIFLYVASHKPCLLKNRSKQFQILVIRKNVKLRN